MSGFSLRGGTLGIGIWTCPSVTDAPCSARGQWGVALCGSGVRDGADLIDLVLLPHSREQGRFPALPDQKDQPAHTGEQRESPTAWGTAHAPEDSPG